MGGEKYQQRYPLLCSDRYVIVEELVKIAQSLGNCGRPRVHRHGQRPIPL